MTRIGLASSPSQHRRPALCFIHVVFEMPGVLEWMKDIRLKLGVPGGASFDHAGFHGEISAEFCAGRCVERQAEKKDEGRASRPSSDPDVLRRRSGLDHRKLTSA
jgi:hypothetical protein